MEAAADVLVSGDEDIRWARAQLNPLLILTPAEFFAWIEGGASVPIVRPAPTPI
jgi:hypothetical protein